MFGTNEIVGQSFFKKQPQRSREVFVTSQFVTLQGEGPFAGMPALFTRLAKCNLACEFCDTWFDSGTWFTPENLLENERLLLERELPHDAGWAFPPTHTARSYTAGVVTEKLCLEYPRRMVYVITGGEPTLQAAARVLADSRLREYQHVQVETNGIICYVWPLRTTVVMSPKAVNGRYQRPAAINEASCFKFVLEAPREGIESPYTTVPSWALDHARENNLEIYVSPMNVYARAPGRGTGDLVKRSAEEVVSFWDEGLLDRERNQKNHEYAARYALQYGLRLNLQMHLYAGLA